MNSSDVSFAAAGAHAFAIVYFLVLWLLSSEPSYANAIVGGVTWFVTALLLRVQMRDSYGE